ncbi:MAG: MBL fold metallo-hydrolase [Polyangiaceae bacterium]
MGWGDSLLAEALQRAAPGCAPQVRLNLLFSHYHWDHIQGLPLFTPLYMPSTELNAYGPNFGGGVAGVLRAQMQAPVFPVEYTELASRVNTRDLTAGQTLEIGCARVTTARLNHPGGVFGYRIEHAGRSVVYATDTEHYACPDPALVKLAQGADVLIYDAMYLPEEYRGETSMSKAGWGHSTYEAAAEVALKAGVRRLVLFHHDPARDDWAVIDLESRARKLFPNCIAAREGQVLDLPLDAQAA